MSELRAAVVGLGMMGRHHARVLSSLPGVSLVAAVDPNGDRHDALAGLEPLTSVADLDGLAIDIAVLASPTPGHTEGAVALADLGISTLVEKPLASTTHGCDEIMAAFAERPAKGWVGHIERFNPAVQALTERLATGESGKVVQILTTRVGPYPHRSEDVGVTMDLATHDFDLVRFIAGSDYADITAHAASAVSSVDDALIATGQLGSGVLVNHVVNWISPVKQRQTTVTCERGTYIVDTLNADLFWQAEPTEKPQWDLVSHARGIAEGDVTRLAIRKREPLASQLEALCAAARGEASHIATLADGRAAVVIAETCLASAGRAG